MGDFSDDDLDGLEEDDLLALDEAVSAPPTQLQQTRNGINGYSHNDPSTNRTGAGLIRGPQNYSIGSQTTSTTSNPNPKYVNPATHQPGPSTQREQWRAQRYAGPTPGLQRAGTTGSISLPHRNSEPRAVPQQTVQQKDTVVIDNNASVDIQRLQAELAQARNEQKRLAEAAKIANDQVLAKNGEISILRSNKAKNDAENERRLEDLQKKHMLDVERHQAEVEQFRKERERLASHNQFLNHERNDENWQLKQANKSVAQEKVPRPNDNTPKRQRKRPAHFGDGFEDDEVMVISPSKVTSKSRNTTPKNGAKRRRDALADSPLKPLELEQSFGFVQDDNEALQPIPEVPQPATISGQQSEALRFLQRLHAHKISKDGKRTLDALAAFSLPLNTKQTLSDVITNKIADLPIGATEDFSSAVGLVVLKVWSNCLADKYHEPLHYLVELIRFTLIDGSKSAINDLLEAIVDHAQRTADNNIIVKFNRFKRKVTTSTDHNRVFDSTVNTTELLELLDLVIILCGRNQELIKRFWKSMRFDFISMVLRNTQEVDDVTLMAKILARSVRSDTFAMIVAPPASQSASEQHVIDRLSSMLVEAPRVPEDESRPDTVSVMNMRLEILSLIDTMTTKKYCGSAFTSHPAALGRLVRVMHDSLNELYTFRHDRSHHAELINQATRLLYHISKDYSQAIGNIQEKLRTPPTSVYKHLIVLSRLAFSEGVVFEQDIDEDVLEMAHEMLEMLTSPEEAEAVERAFRRESSQGFVPMDVG